MMKLTGRKRVLLLCVFLAIGAGLGWFATHPPDLLLSLLRAKTVDGVMEALKEGRPDVVALASGAGTNVTLAAFKRERTLELWSDGRLLKSYPFTGFSGKLGPKVREGDLQIPEGVYAAKSINPNSRFHLSIEVGYPNALEQEAARREGRDNLGGQIFIHGSRASVGCIPIGNQAIDEVFFIVTKVGLERTRIVVAPYDMRKGRDAAVDAEVFPATPWAEAAYQGIEKALVEL